MSDLDGSQDFIFEEETEAETFRGVTLTQTLDIPLGVSMPPKPEPETDEEDVIFLDYLKPEDADIEMPDPSMHPEIMATKQAFPDEDMLAEIDTTAILSELMDVPLDQANQLQKGMTEHPVTKKPLSVKERLGYVKDMWDMGWQDYNMALLGWQILNNEGDVEAAQKQIATMQTGMDLDRRKEVGLFWHALGSAGKMLPIMLKSMEKGMQLGLATGAAGAGMAAAIGQVPPLTAAPEELFTVPGTFATMFGVGATIGSTQHIMKIEAGLSYLEMIQEGIDPEIAKWSSIGVGVVNAGIEVLQIGGILKTIPGVKNILNKSLRRGIANVIKSDVLKNLGRSAMNGLFGVIKEAGQEVAQESVTIVGTEVARELTKLLQEKDVKGKERITLQGRITTQEAVDRLWDTFKESMLSFGVTMLPGTVVSAAIGAPSVKGPGIVAERETVVKQPSQNLDEIYRLTHEAKSAIESKTKEIASAFDSAEIVMRSELKDRGRAEQKIETDYEGDASKISDVQGAFVVVETADDLKAKVKEVAKDKDIVRVKNTYDYPSPVGWRSVLLNVKAPNGAIYEVQVTDKDTYRADVEGLGHSMYSVIRQVDAELATNRENYTVDQQKEIGRITEELADVSYDYYEKAQAEGFDAANAFALSSETTAALDQISESLEEVISSNPPLARSLQSLRTELSNMKASVSPISQVISAIKKPLAALSMGEKKPVVKIAEEKIIPPAQLEEARKYKTAEEYVESVPIKSGKEKREAIKSWKKETGYKEVDSSFDRGDGLHSPSDPETGSPLYNLTENATYPDDVYSINGLRDYSTGEAVMDRQAYNIIRRAEGKPSTQLKIYRAVEKGDPQKILPGDWVTTVRNYAKEHGEGVLKEGYKIVSKLVTAKDLYTNGDSWLEYGYHPQKNIPSSVYRKNKSQLIDIWNKATETIPVVKVAEEKIIKPVPDVLVQPETAKEINAEEAGKALEAAYEKEKDMYFRGRDKELLVNNVETRRLQQQLKKVLGKKKYDTEVKNIDQAIHIHIDTKRNPENINQYYDELTTEQKHIVDLSQNLPASVNKIIDKIDNAYQEMGKRALEEDVIHNTLENYTARVWDRGGEEMASVHRKFGTRTGHAKARVFDTIIEGWAKGYKLKIGSAVNNLNILREEMIKTIQNKQFLKAMAQTKGADGQPLITTKRLEDYKEVQHPNFTTWRYAGKAEPGEVYGKNFFVTDEGTLLEKTRMYAPKKIARNLNNILGSSALKEIPGVKTVTKYNAVIKSWILQSSFFHHLAFVRSYELGTGRKNLKEVDFIRSYKEGVKAIEALQPEIVRGVENGLTLGLRQDWDDSLVREKNALGNILDKTKVTKAIKDKINTLRDQHVDFLFGEFGAGLKAKAFLIEYKNEFKKTPNADPDVVAKRVANLMNDDFGGLHLERMGRNPTVQHIFRILALAPDWTESNVRSMIKTIKAGDKEEVQMYRRFWARIMIKGLGLTAFSNFLLSGADPEEFVDRYKTAWESGNMRWADVDITPIYKLLGGKTKRRKYFAILGHFKDPLKFITHPIRSAHHKGSVLYGVLHEALVGADWAGRKFTTYKELLESGETVRWGPGKPISYDQLPSYILSQLKGFTPVQMQYLLGWLSGETEGFDAIGNSIGLGVRSTYK